MEGTKTQNKRQLKRAAVHFFENAHFVMSKVLSTKLTPVEALELHRAVHDTTRASVSFRGATIAVHTKTNTGLRFVRADRVEVVQQVRARVVYRSR